MFLRAVQELMEPVECPERLDQRYTSFITRQAAHRFNPSDYCRLANLGCALTLCPIRAGRQRIRRTPGAAWREGTQGES